MTLVVTLTVRQEAADQFRAFERHAAGVMARHGGAIERVVVIPVQDEPSLFKEVHIVTFRDLAAFASYQADPALAGVAALRVASVVHTDVQVGEDGPPYDGND